MSITMHSMGIPPKRDTLLLLWVKSDFGEGFPEYIIGFVDSEDGFFYNEKTGEALLNCELWPLAWAYLPDEPEVNDPSSMNGTEAVEEWIEELEAENTLLKHRLAKYEGASLLANELEEDQTHTHEGDTHAR